MKRKRMIVLVGLTIIIFLLLFSANAEARRGGFIIFGWGEHISPVVDLPNPLYEKKDLGYMYSSIRIFFIPVVTWNGKFVLYEGDRYYELSEYEVEYFEAKYGPLHSKVNLWVRYVNWLWLIAPVAILIWLKIEGSRNYR